MDTIQSQRCKFKEIVKNSNFWNINNTKHETYLLKLVDKMCKYEMNLASIVEDTDWTWFCPQRDRWTHVSWYEQTVWTDGQSETSLPHFNFIRGQESSMVDNMLYDFCGIHLLTKWRYVNNTHFAMGIKIFPMFSISLIVAFSCPLQLFLPSLCYHPHHIDNQLAS